MASADSALSWVLDYPAMGRPDVLPRRLHRKDCWHPAQDSEWREATPEELATLPPCESCLAADTDQALEGRSPHRVAAVREDMAAGRRARVRFPGE